jgi:hypothetical protein
LIRKDGVEGDFLFLYPSPNPKPFQTGNSCFFFFLLSCSFKSLLEKYIKSFNGKDIDGFASLFAPEGTFEDPVGLPPLKGPEEIKKFLITVFKGKVLK